MANAKTFSGAVADGQIITPANFDALDNGQAAALCRAGTTTLTADATIDSNGHVLTFSLGGGFPALDTRLVTRFSPAQQFSPGGGTWTASGLVWVNSGTGAQSISIILGYVPPGMVITGFSVPIFPASGHGALPATKPTATLYRCPVSSNPLVSGVPICSATDAPASVVAYETYHLITATGGTYAVATGDLLWMNFAGEGGANAVAGFSLFPISLQGTLSTLRTV